MFLTVCSHDFFVLTLSLSEAFRAFHSFRHGEEDADDSFNLGSPAPRNPPTSVVPEEPEV